MTSLHAIAFWSTVAFVIVGALLGLAGIWLPKSDTGWKLFLTDVVLALSALIVAAITKWLA